MLASFATTEQPVLRNIVEHAGTRPGVHDFVVRIAKFADDVTQHLIRSDYESWRESLFAATGNQHAQQLARAPDLDKTGDERALGFGRLNPSTTTMFGLFESPPFHDPALGELKRSRGHWRGSLALTAEQNLPLALCGNRKEPDPQAVALARAIPASFKSWRAAIETALFEQYEPYAESMDTDEPEPSTESTPTIRTSSEVWPHVSF